MSAQNLELAISPCPNDTFIFYHLLQPGALGQDLEFTAVFEDVEELNRRAIEEARHPITKLSYYAILKLEETYDLLPCGGALGRGCGPLLITGENTDPEILQKSPESVERILIPGRWTTAHLLLRLYLSRLGADLNRIEFVPTRYDRIMPLLKSGEERFGLIIHEERFTYQKLGLVSLQDLGEYWESQTGLPIPLGGIAVRKDIAPEIKDRIQAGIKESLQKSWDNPGEARPFIKKYSQSLEDQVIQSHIDLYVNSYSLDYGADGAEALKVLAGEAKNAGLL